MNNTYEIDHIRTAWREGDYSFTQFHDLGLVQVDAGVRQANGSMRVNAEQMSMCRCVIEDFSDKGRQTARIPLNWILV